MKIQVFHGSKNPILKFDIKKNLSGYYPGFYTSSSKDLAKRFGDIIYSMIIEEDKFYEITDAEELKKKAREAGFNTTQGSGYPESKYLQADGYQGIKRGIEYIVFDPSNSVFDFKLEESLIMSFNKWVENKNLQENTDNNKVKCIDDLIKSIRNWGEKYSLNTRTFVWEHLNSSKGKELLKKILRNPKTYYSDSEFKKLVEENEN